MCARNVFVLVLLCSVNSRAQWGPNPSVGFQNLPELPGIPPERLAPPFRPPRLSDNPGHQDRGPKRPPPPAESGHIPEDSYGNVPPPGFMDNSNHHEMHPPPVILEFPYDQDWDLSPVPDMMDQLVNIYYFYVTNNISCRKEFISFCV